MGKKTSLQILQKKSIDVEKQTDSGKEAEKKQDHPRNKAKNVEVKDAEFFSSPFTLEQEIGKINIPIPLTELVKNPPFK